MCIQFTCYVAVITFIYIKLLFHFLASRSTVTFLPFFCHVHQQLSFPSCDIAETCLPLSHVRQQLRHVRQQISFPSCVTWDSNFPSFLASSLTANFVSFLRHALQQIFYLSCVKCDRQLSLLSCVTFDSNFPFIYFLRHVRQQPLNWLIHLCNLNIETTLFVIVFIRFRMFLWIFQMRAT